MRQELAKAANVAYMTEAPVGSAKKSTHRQVQEQEIDVPNTHSPNITGRLFLEVGTNFLNLGATAGGVVKQVAELAAVGLDINGSLCRPRIAFEDQDLVLWPALVLNGIHGGCDARRWPSLA